MGWLSTPIYWLTFLILGLALEFGFTFGNVFLNQTWTSAALEASTRAGAAQLDVSNGGNHSTGVMLQNQADALNIAYRTWQIEQSLNPFVAHSTATFFVTNNSVTGNANVPINESRINNFINGFGGKKANFGGNLTETVHSTLPSPLTSSLPSPPGSSLPTNTLPKLGSSLPATTLP